MVLCRVVMKPWDFSQCYILWISCSQSFVALKANKAQTCFEVKFNRHKAGYNILDKYQRGTADTAVKIVCLLSCWCSLEHTW